VADRRRTPIRFWEITRSNGGRMSRSIDGAVDDARAVVPHMLRRQRGAIVTAHQSRHDAARGLQSLAGASQSGGEAATAIMSARLAEPGSPPMWLGRAEGPLRAVIADGCGRRPQPGIAARDNGSAAVVAVSDAAASGEPPGAFGGALGNSFAARRSAEKCGAPIAEEASPPCR